MVNLGCCVLSRPPKQGRAHGPPTDIYSRSFVRTGVLTSLIIVVFWNTVMLGLSVGAVVTIANMSEHLWDYGWGSFGDQYSLAGTIFLWLTIPFVLMMNSWTELYMMYRHTLLPKRIVITGSISIVLWCLAAALWSPCTFPSEITFSYCPNLPGPGWVWNWGTLPPPPGVQYLVPWLVIAAVSFYVPYIAFAACARHHARKAAGVNVTKETDDTSFEQAERYKITSSVYTTPDTLSEVGPSTIRSNVFSNRTTRPPSYGERSHAAMSTRVGYSDAIYCKRCHEEVGFARPIHEEEEDEEFGQLAAMHREPETTHVRDNEK